MVATAVCSRTATADDREEISRRMAQKLLREILDHRGQLKPVDGLSKLKPVNPLFDSELEGRLLRGAAQAGSRSA